MTPSVAEKRGAMVVPKRSYASLLGEIKKRIRLAQYEALRSVNKELINLYWDIGGMIVDRQKGDTWGKGVVQQLAADLQKEFPGTGGFSAGNLWRIKSFYETYAGDPKLAPLVREIGWSNNILILERSCTQAEREFYLPKELTAEFPNVGQVKRLTEGLN